MGLHRPPEAAHVSFPRVRTKQCKYGTPVMELPLPFVAVTRIQYGRRDGHQMDNGSSRQVLMAQQESGMPLPETWISFTQGIVLLCVLSHGHQMCSAWPLQAKT